MTPFHPKKIPQFLILYRPSFLVGISLTALCSAILGILSPVFQKYFMDSLTQNSDLSYMYISLAFTSFVGAQFCAWGTQRIALEYSIQIQSVLSQALYKKLLELRETSKKNYSLGELVSLYAVDTAGVVFFIEQTIPNFASVGFPFLITPIVLSLFFSIPIWYSAIWICAAILFIALLAARQARFFLQFKDLAAQRVGLVNEWIQQIRALRFLGATKWQEQKIIEKRVEETENRIKMVTNGQTMSTFGSSYSFVIQSLTLVYFVWASTAGESTHFRESTQNPQAWLNTPPKASELMGLLWVVGVFLSKPLRHLPWLFTFTMDSWTSTQRLRRFFEVQNQNPTFSKFDLTRTLPKSYLCVRDLSLSRNGIPLLKGINLDIQKNEFVAVVGEVGCGKSLMALSLLAETECTFGNFWIDGKSMSETSIESWREQFSFVPQEPFVMSASLRENVLLDYDSLSLNQLDQSSQTIGNSLTLSQFDMRLENLSNGLNTEIGERGVNLSGGQRQRINLARSTYYNRPIVILDDSLSAVDVGTEALLINNLFLGEWKNKTRLLITHRLSILPFTDRVILMQEGRIAAQGRYEDLLKTSSEFQKLMKSSFYEYSDDRSDSATTETSPQQTLR